jgi:1-pyrroline-5-carboxylate dehydrogenase
MTATVDKITYTSTPEQVAAMHAAFDRALAEVESAFGQTYPMVIDGAERTAAATFETRAPANRDLLLGRFQSGTKLDVDDAVAAARSAFPEWSGLDWRERVRILRRAAELVRERKFVISSILVHECGKNRVEAIGEVEEAADMIDAYTAQMEEHDGFVTELGALDPGERNRSVLRPFGVWAVLAPFNFPFALSLGMSSGALLAGNTVVYKPASATPISGFELQRIWREAGVPAGVFNFVTGSGDEVGESLALHPGVDGVIFTGSKEVGFDLYKRIPTNWPKPVITELGGKNPTIVTAKADLAKAVEGVARSAFGFSGQKCSACSRVYVERPVYDEFVERLTARASELLVGDPTDKDSFLGPVINDRAANRYREAIDIAKRDGGQIRTGGKTLSGGLYDKGNFVAPTVIDGLPVKHELFKRELFLPLVVVGPVDSLDQALDEANDTEYGLTAGIFSEDRAEIDRFFDRIEAGVVYANRKGGSTTGAWPGCQSFAGWKGSGSSGKGGLGPWYVQQFMREQSRTIVVDPSQEDVSAEQAAGE